MGWEGYTEMGWGVGGGNRGVILLLLELAVGGGGVQMHVCGVDTAQDICGEAPDVIYLSSPILFWRRFSTCRFLTHPDRIAPVSAAIPGSPTRLR